jgi:hypothetical protein
MKKFALTLSLLLVLGGKAMAYGCCCFWPGFGIGVGLGGFCGFSLGLGLGGLGCGLYCGAGYPAYGYAYSQPAYGYTAPAYGYGYGYGAPAYGYGYGAPAYGYGYPANDIDPPAPSPAPSYDWVPSTPGVGHWVPEPAPYSFTPASALPRLRQAVTVTRSPDGIPVYSISYVR